MQLEHRADDETAGVGVDGAPARLLRPVRRVDHAPFNAPHVDPIRGKRIGGVNRVQKPVLSHDYAHRRVTTDRVVQQQN